MEQAKVVETGKYIQASALALPPAVWTLILGLGGILAFTFFGAQYGTYINLALTIVLLIARGYGVKSEEVIEIINHGMGGPVVVDGMPTPAAASAPDGSVVTIAPAQDGKLRRFLLN